MTFLLIRLIFALCWLRNLGGS